MELDIKDLSAGIAELAGKKPADFIDDNLLREVEKQGFFSWAKR
jgi:hypothetical protein